LGTWSKNYWADCEQVWFFLNLIFSAVRILSFNAIDSVIKKMFHKGPVAAMGPVRNGIFLNIVCNIVIVPKEGPDAVLKIYNMKIQYSQMLKTSEMKWIFSNISRFQLLLLCSLYISSVLRITAVFILRHLGPVIQTSALLKKERPQQVTHLPPVWDLLLALA
jgi:hypothetical protein